MAMIYKRHAYPDSVNLVNPPNTTIPNTLAALPNNQYATPLLLVFGKNPFFACCSARPIVWLRPVNGVPTFAAITLFPAGAVEL